MSSVMIMRVAGDPAKLEEYCAANADHVKAIASSGQSAGATRHLFAGREGEIIVIDEWPDEASFQGFFANQQGPIGEIMQAVGATSQPEITFYRRLDTPDAF